MTLKKFDWIKKYIKLSIAYPDYGVVFKKLMAQGKKRAIFIGSPVHGNLGDQLIALECLDFIQDLGYEELIEIPEFVYELFPQRISIQPLDDVFITGGGWMGDMYEDELVIESIIKNWPNNRIVILPQTIFFSGSNVMSSPEQLRRVFNKASNLIVCVRDRQSYEVCLTLLGLGREQCFLLPDMALLKLKDIIIKDYTQTNRVLFSLRNDTEKIQKTDILKKIIKSLEKEGIKCVYSSTVLNQKIGPFKKRTNAIQDKISEFNYADLIVTDRLHSMVFSLLAGTKCIALDNSTHKVSGVYQEWLKDIPGLLVLDNADQLTYGKLRKILKSGQNPDPLYLDCKFNRLIDALKEVKVYE